MPEGKKRHLKCSAAVELCLPARAHVCPAGGRAFLWWFEAVALPPVLEGQMGWQGSSSPLACGCVWKMVFRGALCLGEGDFRDSPSFCFGCCPGGGCEASLTPPVELWLLWLWAGALSCFLLFCLGCLVRLVLKKQKAQKLPGLAKFLCTAPRWAKGLSLPWAVQLG